MHLNLYITLLHWPPDQRSIFVPFGTPNVQRSAVSIWKQPQELKYAATLHTDPSVSQSLNQKRMINCKFYTEKNKKHISVMSQKFSLKKPLKCLQLASGFQSCHALTAPALDKIFAGWPKPINDTLKHRESKGTLAAQQIPVGKWKHVKLLNVPGFEARKKRQLSFWHVQFISFNFMRLWGKRPTAPIDDLSISGFSKSSILRHRRTFLIAWRDETCSLPMKTATVARKRRLQLIDGHITETEIRNTCWSHLEEFYDTEVTTWENNSATKLRRSAKFHQMITNTRLHTTWEEKFHRLEAGFLCWLICCIVADPPFGIDVI